MKFSNKKCPRTVHHKRVPNSLMVIMLKESFRITLLAMLCLNWIEIQHDFCLRTVFGGSDEAKTNQVKKTPQISCSIEKHGEGVLGNLSKRPTEMNWIFKT